MQLSWQEPLEFSQRFADEDTFVLLHSSLHHPQHGTLSILAVNPKTIIEDDFDALFQQLENAKPFSWNHCWFGFLSYEAFAPLPHQPSATFNLPDIWFTQFHTHFVFNHTSKTLTRFGPKYQPNPIERPKNPLPKVLDLQSNMTKQTYLDSVEQTLEKIKAGEFYQANITRKFFGTFEVPPEGLALFAALCNASPASYSAYIKCKGHAILSSSPECFLTIDETGLCETRPIKGTAPRNSDPKALHHSVKDRAENLMIVDLMRNDLAQHCEAGTVQTHGLFNVTTYNTLHHMASTITAQRKIDSTMLDVIQGCHPPGSMTGAPKKAVIQWCKHVEKAKRGIYSGCIGWLAPNGSCNLSVVIRTLIVKDNQFEFQVGGGIVADSIPILEWNETLTKAKGITNALNIPDLWLKK